MIEQYPLKVGIDELSRHFIAILVGMIFNVMFATPKEKMDRQVKWTPLQCKSFDN